MNTRVILQLDDLDRLLWWLGIQAHCSRRTSVSPRLQPGRLAQPLCQQACRLAACNQEYASNIGMIVKRPHEPGAHAGV